MSIAGYKTEFMVGDYVTRGTWKGKVLGHAKGQDGQDCLCVHVCGKYGMDGSHWKTWLWPESKCKPFKEPPPKAPDGRSCDRCNNYVAGACWRTPAFGMAMPSDGFCSYWSARAADE